ncbi:MAG TPA: SRPBCC family protein [Terriglobales bacterium]|nr:SRPBCC family protein [Terriglobales bacterium]
MAGHVDVRVVARAPLNRVWTASTDPEEWARAGHPVRDVERRGDRLRFRVSAGGLVERVQNLEQRTVYSRRLDAEFIYCHVWFGHEEVPGGTEVRCVADFETAPWAMATDTEMEAVIRRALRANLAATARLAELPPGA